MRHRAAGFIVSAAVLALACSARRAEAQIVANPNQVGGEIRLVNADPVLLDLLRTPLPPEDPRGFTSGWIDADSLPPAPSMSATTTAVVHDPLRATYELTVDGAVPGIAYRVRPEMTLFGYFPCAIDALDTVPIEPEPSPDARLDFTACVGAIRVTVVDSAGGPVTRGDAWTPGSFNADWQERLDATGQAWLLSCRDGGTVNVRVRGLVGTGWSEAGQDGVPVRCDGVTPVTIVLPDPLPPSPDRGRIVGEVDLIGIAETRSVVTSCETDAQVELVPGAGPFTFDDLTLGTCTTGVRSFFDVAGSEQELRLTSATRTITAGVTIDLGEHFVIDPTHVTGDVVLDAPPAVPGAGTGMLAWLEEPVLRVMGTSGRGPGARTHTVGLECNRDVPGVHDSVTGTWSGRLDLYTGGPYREASIQSFQLLELAAKRDDDPTDARQWFTWDARVDDGEWSYETMRPGQALDMPRLHCFNELHLRIHSTGRAFYLPNVRFENNLFGNDSAGRRRRHSMMGGSYGIPVTFADASVDGAVLVLVPEGPSTLRPWVTYVNGDGTTSRTELPPIVLTLGCRETLDALPSFFVRTLSSPTCAGTSPVTVEGVVTADAAIASIAWRAETESGTEVSSGIACAPCGSNPEYSFTFLPPGAPIRVTVTATDASGAVATSTVFAEHAQEPSALDASPGDEPLRVTRDAGGDVVVTWSPSPGSGWALYEGTIGALEAGLYDHRGVGACDLAQPRWSGIPPAWDVYYLATAQCAYGDASLGRDSSGAERPGAIARCP